MDKMQILVPVVESDKESGGRKAFLYIIRAYKYEGIDGIALNQDDQIWSLQKILQELHPGEHHIEVDIDPLDKATPEFGEYDPINEPSLKLAAFLAIEHFIFNRQFKENYDYLVVTGDVDGNQVHAIGDEDKKLAALESLLGDDDNKNKIGKFIYVKDQDTLRLEGKAKQRMDIERVTDGTGYNEIVSSVFSDEGDTVEYYATYVDKNGIPEGIRRLTQKEVLRRNISYKFIYRNNVLIRIEYINDENWLYGESDEICIEEFIYPDANTLKILYKTCLLQIKRIHEYKRDKSGLFNRINIYNSYETAGESPEFLQSEIKSYKNSQVYTLAGKTRINGHILERNSLGYITKKQNVRFHNSNVLQNDSNGVAGYEFLLNDLGLPISTFYLDTNGMRKEYYDCDRANEKIFREDDKYNEFGEIIERRFIRADGTLICILKVACDETGKQTAFAYFDDNHNKIHSSDGWHKLCCDYLSNYSYVMEFKDKYENTAYSLSKGYAKLVIEKKHIEHGWIIRESVFDSNNIPDYRFCKEGRYALREVKLNEYKLPIEKRFYNHNSELIYSARYKYDSRGNEIESAFYDCNNKLTWNYGEFPLSRSEYDTAGRRIKIKHYDCEGNLVGNSNDAAIKELEYDEETGNLLSISEFNDKYIPTIHPNGFHKAILNFNEMGLLLKFDCYNTNGELIDGICTYTYDYDSDGNILRFSSYNKNSELVEDDFAVLCFNRSGDKEIIEARNKKNKIIFTKINKFDKYGSILKEIGYIKGKRFSECFNYEYDNKNRITLRYYTNKKNELIYTPLGYAKIEYKYDEVGNLIERKYYGKKGNLVNIHNGYAKEELLYDKKGNLIEKRFYNRLNKPCNFKNGAFRYIAKYNQKGLCVERYAYNSHGEKFEFEKSVFGYKFAYNLDNTLHEIRYLDENNGLLKKSKNNASMQLFQYISSQQCICNYLDWKGNKINEELFFYKFANEENMMLTFYNSKHRFSVILEERSPK